MLKVMNFAIKIAYIRLFYLGTAFVSIRLILNI